MINKRAYLWLEEFFRAHLLFVLKLVFAYVSRKKKRKRKKKNGWMVGLFRVARCVDHSLHTRVFYTLRWNFMVTEKK